MRASYLIFTFFPIVFSFAQVGIDEDIQDSMDINKSSWLHQSVEESGVYGVGTDKALEFLKSKQLKPVKVIVGVLDSGVDIEHEDLKDNIWVNPDEKDGNGIDDDKNGYIDDINGWSFIGGISGGEINKDTYEATRIVNQWNPIFHSGNKEKDLLNIRNMPNQYRLYLKARKAWANEYSKSKRKIEGIERDKIDILDLLEQIRNHTGYISLTPENIDKQFKEKGQDSNQEIKSRLLFILEANPSFYGKTMDEIIKHIQKGFDNQEKELKSNLSFAYNREFDPRKIVGDDFENKTERFYGSNKVEGPDALHGTHVAGIIAAIRANNIGIDGIAGNVAKIMSVRAVPDGDERDKDVANAIRYAVDNGARIINMSFGKSFSPEKKLVWNAVKYANAKGVLLLHAAGNANRDIDLGDNYPSNFKGDSMTPFVKNWITIGASTRVKNMIKASFSNYGNARVDVFAPGSEIYSTIPDNKYRYLQGTSMASPVVAGCAALIWAYFPKLTASQVKSLLLETVNLVDQDLKVGSERDTRNFKELSISGGVVDLYKAVVLAYDRYGKEKRRNKKRRK